MTCRRIPDDGGAIDEPKEEKRTANGRGESKSDADLKAHTQGLPSMPFHPFHLHIHLWFFGPGNRSWLEVSYHAAPRIDAQNMDS